MFLRAVVIMDGLQLTIAVYLLMSTVDLIAAVIAFYIFFRLVKTFIKTGILSIGLISFGFFLMFLSFTITSFFYSIASQQAWDMLGHMPEWMRRMHHTMPSYMARMMPMHWPLMVEASGAFPIPWFGLRVLLLSSYVLILAGYLLSRIDVSREQGPEEQGVERGFVYAKSIPMIALLPYSSFLASVNLMSLAVLSLTVALLATLYKKVKTAVILGFIALALSHLIEIILVAEPSVTVLIVSELLRPLAMFSIAVGVSNEGKE